MIDNYKAAYEATKHLLDQGCKRILHLGGNKERNVYADRLRGYRHALRDAGIAYDEKLVRISQLLESAGAEAAAWILKMKPRNQARRSLRSQRYRSSPLYAGFAGCRHPHSR